MRSALGFLGVAIGALVAVEAVMQPTWGDRISFVLIFAGAALLAAATGGVLNRWVRRLRSIHAQVLVMSLSAVGLVAVVVTASARLMFLSSHDLRVVMIALLLAVGLGIGLSASLAGALSRDLSDLHTSIRAVAGGDLTVRTATDRTDEVGELADAFDDMTRMLADANASRDRAEAARRSFLAAVSHDLRTPLTALRVAVEALEDGIAPDPGRYVRSLGTDLDALSRLVDDLFLLSRIEAGRLEMAVEPVDVADVVDEVVEAMQPVADRSLVRLHFRQSGLTRVLGGPAELGRVVRNLLENAIRYAPAGSAVDVSVGRDNGHVRVSVGDQGPGFPDALRRDAARHFARADAARSRAHGGAGLGLTIAGGLIEAHGGSLRIGMGPGGRVTFAIPAADARPIGSETSRDRPGQDRS